MKGFKSPPDVTILGQTPRPEPSRQRVLRINPANAGDK